MTSGTRRIILVLLFTALLVVSVNLAWWYYYQKTSELLDDQLGRRLSAVALSASIAIPPHEVDLLTLDDLNAYLHALDILQSVQASDSLSEVFILDENQTYLATTSLEPDSVYFLSALNGPLIDSLFYGGQVDVLTSSTYRTGDVLLKSAFVPLLGSDGIIAAVLGVEADVDYFDSLAELRHNLYIATGFSLLGGIILGVIFVLLQRRVNRTEQQLFLGQTHAHLGRMVAVVAHELKNPLMIIRASAERLKKKTDMSEAEYVCEEVDRLNGIVTGYLDFARSGGSLLTGDSKQPVNLGELVANVRAHLTDKHAETPIEWLGGPIESASTIQTYPRSLRQVLLNLLLNGLESCRAAERPVKVGIEITEDSSHAVLDVIDRGPGFPRKEVSRVFTPFYTTKQSGSGLGLYLCRRIVEEMGGGISIDSRPGEETRVRVKLPKERA